MSLISIDIQCTECGNVWDDLVERTEQDNYHLCPECGLIAGRKTISMPMILKASHPDGTKRFSDLKEVARLKRLKTRSNDGADRHKISSEIKKLKGKEYE